MVHHRKHSEVHLLLSKGISEIIADFTDDLLEISVLFVISTKSRKVLRIF